MATQPEVRCSLQLVAAVTQHVHVPVYVLATEGQRAHVIHVHTIGAVRFQTPVAPGRAPFLHEPAEPRSSVVPGRSSPTPGPP